MDGSPHGNVHNRKENISVGMWKRRVSWIAIISGACLIDSIKVNLLFVEKPPYIVGKGSAHNKLQEGCAHFNLLSQTPVLRPPQDLQMYVKYFVGLLYSMTRYSVNISIVSSRKNSLDYTILSWTEKHYFQLWGLVSLAANIIWEKINLPQGRINCLPRKYNGWLGRGTTWILRILSASLNTSSQKEDIMGHSSHAWKYAPPELHPLQHSSKEAGDIIVRCELV